MAFLKKETVSQLHKPRLSQKSDPQHLQGRALLQLLTSFTLLCYQLRPSALAAQYIASHATSCSTEPVPAASRTSYTLYSCTVQ